MKDIINRQIGLPPHLLFCYPLNIVNLRVRFFDKKYKLVNKCIRYNHLTDYID